MTASVSSVRCTSAEPHSSQTPGALGGLLFLIFGLPSPLFLLSIVDVKGVTPDGMTITISSEKINEYMKKKVCVTDTMITSSLINSVLEEAEKRGDL